MNKLILVIAFHMLIMFQWTFMPLKEEQRKVEHASLLQPFHRADRRCQVWPWPELELTITSHQCLCTWGWVVMEEQLWGHPTSHLPPPLVLISSSLKHHVSSQDTHIWCFSSNPVWYLYGFYKQLHAVLEAGSPPAVRWQASNSWESLHCHHLGHLHLGGDAF